MNNGYLKHVEGQINSIVENNIFLMNRKIRGTSTFKNGFAVATTMAQIPVYIAISVFLVVRFMEVLWSYESITWFNMLLVICLICEGIAIGRMLYDVVNVQQEVIRKIDELIAKENEIK